MHKTVVKVIGIGGAGNHALNAMIDAHVSGVEFVALDTDAEALRSSLALNKIQIGKRSTKDFGAGGNLEVGRRAARESFEEIAWMLYNTDLVFLLAGMGGGTGSGSAPIIAQLAKKQECLVVPVVTRPFLFEGKRRLLQTERGLQELREVADVLLVIPNHRSLELAGRNISLRDAFHVCDNIVGKTVQGISDLLIPTGFINIDFADLQTTLGKAGDAFIGIGASASKNEDRAVKAATRALLSPLLEEEFLASARRVLINITGGPDLTLFDVDEAASLIKDAAHEDANIIFGAVIDEKMQGEIRVTVIAAAGDEEGDNGNHKGGNHSLRA